MSDPIRTIWYLPGLHDDHLGLRYIDSSLTAYGDKEATAADVHWRTDDGRVVRLSIEFIKFKEA